MQCSIVTNLQESCYIRTCNLQQYLPSISRLVLVLTLCILKLHHTSHWFVSINFRALSDLKYWHHVKRERKAYVGDLIMSHDVKQIKNRHYSLGCYSLQTLCWSVSSTAVCIDLASKALDMNIICWLGFLFSLLRSLPHIYIHVLQGQCK